MFEYLLNCSNKKMGINEKKLYFAVLTLFDVNLSICGPLMNMTLPESGPSAPAPVVSEVPPSSWLSETEGKVRRRKTSSRNELIRTERASGTVIREAPAKRISGIYTLKTDSGRKTTHKRQFATFPITVISRFSYYLFIFRTDTKNHIPRLHYAFRNFSYISQSYINGKFVSRKSNIDIKSDNIPTA